MKFPHLTARWAIICVIAAVAISAGVLLADAKSDKHVRDDPHLNLQMYKVAAGAEDDVHNAADENGIAFDYYQNDHHHVKRPGGRAHRDNECPLTFRTNAHITQNATFQKVKKLRAFISKGKLHDD